MKNTVSEGKVSLELNSRSGPSEDSVNLETKSVEVTSLWKRKGNEENRTVRKQDTDNHTNTESNRTEFLQSKYTEMTMG